MVATFKKIVFTNGCFYLLHPGHVDLFRKIKKLFPDHKLIVGINSQKSIHLNKNDRALPLFSDMDRKFMIESIEWVDEVILFDERTPLNLIQRIKPSILVKGADYLGKYIVGAEYVSSVVLINFSKDYSTSKILKQIKNS